MVIHHPGKTLEVVITKETAPIGLPLMPQGQAIPRQRHQGGQGQAPQGPEPPQNPPQIGLEPSKGQPGEGRQHNRHRSFGQDRQSQQ